MGVENFQPVKQILKILMTSMYIIKMLIISGIYTKQNFKSKISIDNKK